MTERRVDTDNWQEQYKRKVVSPEEAARVIKSGDNVFMPSTFTGQVPACLVERAGELENVTVEAQAPPDPGWFEPGMEKTFRIIPRIYLGPRAREPHDENRISFLPYTNNTWSKLYRDERPGRRSVDVLLVDVSPPDENGFMTFGGAVWERRGYSKIAKTIIAEIDQNHIRARGDTFIHVSQVDYIVDQVPEGPSREELEAVVAKMPAEYHDAAWEAFETMRPRMIRYIIDNYEDIDPERLKILLRIDTPDEATIAICKHVKTLARDGDTIQIGIGRPSMYIIEQGAFDDVNDLSIFSEMACRGMGFLIKRGIANGKHATLHPGKAVFAALTGMTREELDWVNDNPLIEQYSSDYVVNIANIMKQKNMLAINNATQIDLIGQITCETQFGPRMINGPGGQIEFAIGAFCAPGGRSVTLLYSTWADGAISTIAPYLEQGSMISVPRAYADYVITEWGIAELAGKTHRERADALIEIAHPDFRDELREGAQGIF